MISVFMHEELIRVFVYGTLKPGGYYYGQYCDGRVIESFAAIAYGTLFDLPMGYPAVAPGNHPVHGVVLCFADTALLDMLDDLEDYVPGRSPDENEYNRHLIDVFAPEGDPLGTAWIYMMDTDKALAFGGTVVPDGVWAALSQ
jgi:gamma-glutamylcyclotransferase (GGCT)/AIG2-like uncharacterized protein YtfP